MTSKTAGIIGGMGPLSTIELMKKIYLRTPVQNEQQHLRILVDNRPQIPDRTDFILGLGASPVPLLQDSALLLEKWGADFIAIACNTAHLFYEEIAATVNIPLLNMLELLAANLATRFEEGSPLALLTTVGAIKSRLFQRYLKNFQLLIPPEQIQQKYISKAIYGIDGVKTGQVSEKNKTLLHKAVKSLDGDSPQLIIAGCTEIGLILQEIDLGIETLNPLDLLAEEIVIRALAT